MRKRGCAAFTLLELTIVLVIVGFMSTLAIQMSSGLSDVKCYESTADQIAAIDRAIQDFVIRENRLPKPAYLNLGTSNPSYGSEARPATPLPTSAAYATHVPTGMTVSGGMIIGTVPHATLGLASSYGSDCWGNKFIYAVTNALTSSDISAGYRATATTGSIVLNHGTLASPQQLSDRVGYVVISHGQDEYGANPLAASDQTVRHCGGASGNRIDKENCDISTGANATFFSAPINIGETAQASYFDDIIHHWIKPDNLSSTGSANLYCWGRSTFATLGSTGGDTANPRLTELNAEVVQMVSNSRDSRCARTVTDQVYCWGSNTYGHVDTTVTARPVPQEILPGETFRDVAIHDWAACAIHAVTGRTWCWGYSGYVGSNAGGSRIAPTEISGGHLFDRLQNLSEAMCGITAAGETWCWGRNRTGSLGVGSNTDTIINPTRVVGTQRFTRLVFQEDNNTCGLDDAGNAWCWGSNSVGQLGNGFTNTGTGRGFTSAPAISFSGGGSGSGAAATAYVTGDTITSVSLDAPGSGYTSLLSTVLTGGGGTDAVIRPQMSFNIGSVTVDDGGSNYTSTPTVSFTGSGTGAAATATIGRCVSGLNLTAQGAGYTSAPTVVFSGGGGSGATATAYVSSGRVYLVLLGNRGAYTSNPTVSFVGGGGSGATATLTTTGCVTGVTVTAQGSGYSGSTSLGFSGGGGYSARGTVNHINGFVTGLSITLNNKNENTPQLVTGGHTFTSLTSSDASFCGLKANGEVWCWGARANCQLGNNPPSCSSSPADQNTPVQVAGSVRFSNIFGRGAGYGAIFNSGYCGVGNIGGGPNRMYCWGDGFANQNGNNSSSDNRQPGQVADSFTYVRGKSAGNTHCGLTDTNELQCWGHNSNGALGIGSYSSTNTPTKVTGTTTWAEFDPGDYTSCALRE